MQLSAKAYAKINLYLDVLGKRSDGYHLLAMIMQSVDLYDLITVKKTATNEINVICENSDINSQENIVYKAAKAFLEKINSKIGLDIYVEKNIPIAAGTAGGSADAAATLKLLNILTDANLTDKELADIGVTLGADVPFCLLGGTAYAGGIGEELKPLNTPPMYYVMLKNRTKRSTGEMYKQLDECKYKKDKDINCLISGIEKGDFPKIYDNIFNAFEYCWDFSEMSKPFSEFAPKKIFLSGSGPTVCAAFETEKEALNCYDKLKNLGAKFAKSKNVGVEIV